MIKKFVADRNGSVVVMFAFLFFVIVGLAGVAIDQTVGYTKHNRLQDAADAATLAASREIASGENWSAARKRGESIFNLNVQDPEAKISLTHSGESGKFQVKATAQAPWMRTFTKLLDDNDRMIVVESEAVRPLQPLEVIFLADVSYSMGIGATLADIGIMTRTIACAFACHADGTDKTVHAAGARMRIDVIRDAFVESVRDIAGNKSPNDIIRVGLITFSNDAVDVVEPTADLKAVEAQANLIQFPPASGYSGTDFHSAAAKAVQMIADRKKVNQAAQATYVVIWLTDTIEDNRMLLPGRVSALDATIPLQLPLFTDGVTGHTVQTFAPDLCDGLKDAGAHVMVLNTEYVTSGYNSPTANRVRDQLLPYVPERIAKCATSSNFVKSANDDAGIREAAAELTKLAVSEDLRITK